MSNALFEAALLQRGLRAMDVMLTSTYQVTDHICLPQGGDYPKEFPANGIDFRTLGGVEPLKGIWRNWMYQEGGKGELKPNVHSMVNDTVVEAFKVIGKCDKDENSHITKDEWDTCQKGSKAEDAYYDFEYAFALYRVSGLMMKLEKEGVLFPTNPETYPELIDAKTTIGKRDGQISTLQANLARTEQEASLYQKLFMGSGLLGVVALIFGVRATMRNRKRKDHPEVKRAIARDQINDPGIPKPKSSEPAPKTAEPAKAADASKAETSPPPLADDDPLAAELAKLAGDLSPEPAPAAVPDKDDAAPKAAEKSEPGKDEASTDGDADDGNPAPEPA